MAMDGYFSERFTRPMCWIDLLLLAEWQNEKIFYIRGSKVVVKRGQIAISIEDLSKRWKLSKNTVQKYLKDFETSEQIIIKRSNIVNIITIINYDKYQSNYNGMQNDIKNDMQNDTQNDMQIDCKKHLLSDNYNRTEKNNDIQNDMQNDTQNDMQIDMPIKNIRIYNNIKEDKEKKRRRAPFHPPSIDDVRSYVLEKGYMVDAEQFVNFYESKDWMIGRNKMYSWRAAIATWQKREIERNGNFQQNTKNRRGSIEISATGEEDYTTTF